MLKKSVTRILKSLRKAVLIFVGSTILITLVYRFIPPLYTPLMLIRCYQQAIKGEKLKLKKKWVSLENIAPYMVEAVIASEDNRFMDHFGFDFDAIQKARKLNQKRKKVLGASTISQQTAKNVFLWPKRSYLRKALEVYFTILIETLWSKQRIMEVYLNIIETGKGIYGVEAAANAYYNKPALKLSLSEAAYIASILPNPRKWNPKNPTKYLIHRQHKIMAIMKQLGSGNFYKQEKKPKRK